MIQFHEEVKLFILYNDQISYIFKILKKQSIRSTLLWEKNS